VTNEELAAMAAQGDIESLHKLYFAVKPLLFKLISRYFPLCKNSLAEPEDLLQCGYFAVLEAINDFSPDKGLLFNSYLGYHVKNVCLAELGFKGKRQVETISLDAPISEEGEDFTLEDVICAPSSDTYSYCELNDMRLIVRQEIDKLPPREQIYIYYRYYEEKTITEIGKIMGWERWLTWDIRCSAFNILRKSEAIQELGKVYQFSFVNEFSNPESIIIAFEDGDLELI
jgi:RNA polymerase sporulation-specific sigma factor